MKNKFIATVVILFVLNIFFMFTLKAQPTKVIRVTPDEVWEGFLANGVSELKDIIIDQPKGRYGQDVAKFRLIKAYLIFYNGTCDRETIRDVNNILSGVREAYPNFEEIRGFQEKQSNLKDRIAECLENSANTLIEEISRDVVNNIKDSIDVKLNEQKAKLRDCYSLKSIADVVKSNTDVEFTYEITFTSCDSMTSVMTESYDVGRLGAVSFYQIIADELFRKFLIPVYIDGGYDSIDIKNFIKVDIFGESDALPIKGYLYFEENLMIPSDIRYESFIEGSGEKSKSKVSEAISNYIYSNEELAFCRAYLAYSPIKSLGLLAENQPRIVAKQHVAGVIGKNYRKVKITIYAKNLKSGLRKLIDKKLK